MPPDAQYRAAGQAHAGLILVSTKTFAQDRTYATAITSALIALSRPILLPRRCHNAKGPAAVSGNRASHLH